MAKKRAARPESAKSSATGSGRKKKKAAGKKKQTPAKKSSRKPTAKAATSTGSTRDAGDKQQTSSADNPDDCIVVGVGASAGGLDAYKRLLNALQSNTGMAFVLIQHLDPTHESLMADLLSKYTSMPVVQVEGPTAIRPNRIYMIPPNKYIKIHDGGLFLDEPVKDRGMRMPIDYFFRSLAEARAERGVCVVLSGTGTDGTQGLKEVKAAGGMTVAQKPDTSEYDGMPRSAIGTGMVDFVLPIEEMPEVLVRYSRHPYTLTGGEKARLYDASPDHFKSILSLLQAHTDYDFRCYKKGTLNRRIQRRMGLRHVETVGDYLALLRGDSTEVQALFKDLLIGVTRFFREPEAWQALEKEVIVPLLGEKGYDDPVRVWVPGCATGEEAYSLGILMYEQFERQKRNHDLQLFGTDLDDEAISVARSGSYPASIAADVSPSRLKRFFVDDGDHLRMNKRLRETAVFAVQNIISDPPFSNLDLISCRNVLIYLEAEIQKKLMKMFHFALRPGGYLFLGTSESVPREGTLFQPVSSTWRIYRKVGRQRGGKGTFPIVPSGQRTTAAEAILDRQFEAPVGTVEIARKALLDRFVPPSALVDSQGQVQYFHGGLRDYLTMPDGEPTRDLLALAADGLKSKLRGVIRRAIHEQKRASAVAPRVRRNGDTRAVRITAQPVTTPGDKQLLLVSFLVEPRVTPPAPPEADGEPPAGQAQDPTEQQQLVQQLEYELQATREDLQSMIEELETSNEELKASNEEVMSMNEELQSTNEELETSREELQSLNEELSTVNNQLQEKVKELEATNNDMTNLLTSTEIATIFLDTDFRIRRFTPICTELLHIIPSDTGRPISDLSPRVNDPDLFEDAQNVLETLTPVEREVQNGNRRAFMRRILPYRTSENRIDGVVVTFTDISQLQTAHRQVEIREQQQAAVARLGRLALSETELQPLFDAATKLVAETLDVECAKILEVLPDGRELLLRAGFGWDEGLVGECTVGSGVESQAGFTLQSGGPVVVEDLNRERRFQGPPLLLDHDIVSGMSVMIGPDQAPWGVIGAHAKSRREFNVDDINFLQSVAHVLSEAIANGRYEEKLEREAFRARVVHETTVMAAETDSVHETLQGCVSLICRLTNWPVGHVYEPDADDPAVLIPTDIWTLPPDGTMEAFRRITEESRFRVGDTSLPGRTAEAGGPVWVDDVHEDSGFQRVKACPHLRLRGAFAFPIRVRGRVAAVLEFFHTDAVQASDDLRETFAIAGEQVGRVFERRQAEQRLRDRENRLNLVANAMPVLIAYCDCDLIYRYCNSRYEEWFGLTRKQVIGRSLADVIGEDAFQKVEPYIKRVVGGERVTFEQLLPYRHGPARHVYVEYIPHTTERGEVTGYYAMIQDVSERIRAEHAQARLAAIVEHSHDAILGKDLNGIVTTWNAAAERLYGYTAEEIIGQPVSLLAPDNGRKSEMQEILERVRRGEAIEQLETARCRKDGSLVDILLTVSPIRGTDGKIEGASSIAHDITGRLRAERELQEWADRLEERVAERTAIARKRASDLRELAGQLAHAEQRARKRLAQAIHDDLQQVLVATKMRLPRQQEIVSGEQLDDVAELLDEALRRSRSLVSELSPPVLQEGSLEDALSWLVRHMQEQHGLRVELECNGDLTAVDEDTRTVMFEAIRELLFNVVKHAGTDNARLVVRRNKEKLNVRVADSGNGFDPDLIGNRSDGFGLFNLRERIDAFGGDVDIKAAPGNGARFKISLPLEHKRERMAELQRPPKDRTPKPPKRTEDGDTLRILIADDHQIVREGLARILATEPGMEVVGEAADGREAVEKALELHPDVVVMDISMPNLNGIEATREIVDRLDETLVIGLSLHDAEDLGVAIQQAGAAAYLRKDAASTGLIDAIREQCAANESDGAHKRPRQKDG